MLNHESLHRLIHQIDNCQPIGEALWLDCLMQDDVNDRYEVNRQLALAFLRVNDFKQAKVHAERAWTLNDFNPENAEAYSEILREIDDIDRIVCVYKQTGMAESQRMHYASAINYFQKAWYAKALHEKKDRFEYDFDILDTIVRMAEPFKKTFEARYQKKLFGAKRIKIAYLTYGLADVGSVFAKFIPLYAKYHDLQSFEVTFFIPNREEWILSQSFSKHVVQEIESFHCRVICASNDQDRFQRWVDFSQKICAYQPDYLITFAGLACLEHFFIASTLPKDIRKIALVYGPPAQFIPPTFDYAMSTTIHPLLDSLITSSMEAPILLESTRPHGEASRKEDFNIPATSVVLCSCGRSTKFQEDLFWEMVLKVMTYQQDLHFLCAGPRLEEIHQVALWPQTVLERCHFLGWQANASQLLACGDIYINTFPNGGGYTVVEAIENGMPVISFEHNYFQKFDQTCWNPIRDFIDVQELLISQWNQKLFIEKLLQLIQDAEFRDRMANACLQSLKRKMPPANKSMQDYESALKRMFR